MFPYHVWRKRGCVLSPFLFVLAVCYILHDCTGLGKQIGKTEQLDDLEFADDITLMESNKTKFKNLLSSVRENAGRHGLKINNEKTKSMAVK